MSCAIAELGLTRIEIRTSVDNTRSRALAERLGFALERTLPGGLRFANRSEDVAFYAISADRFGPA